MASAWWCSLQNTTVQILDGLTLVSVPVSTHKWPLGGALASTSDPVLTPWSAIRYIGDCYKKQYVAKCEFIHRATVAYQIYKALVCQPSCHKKLPNPVTTKWVETYFKKNCLLFWRREAQGSSEEAQCQREGSALCKGSRVLASSADAATGLSARWLKVQGRLLDWSAVLPASSYLMLPIPFHFPGLWEKC